MSLLQSYMHVGLGCLVGGAIGSGIKMYFAPHKNESFKTEATTVIVGAALWPVAIPCLCLMTLDGILNGAKWSIKVKRTTPIDESNSVSEKQ